MNAALSYSQAEVVFGSKSQDQVQAFIYLLYYNL